MNILIEYDGIQHFKPVNLFGGIEEFDKTIVKDKIKSDYCMKNNINLVRISYNSDVNTELNYIFK
jgi:hypothetical protein